MPIATRHVAVGTTVAAVLQHIELDLVFQLIGSVCGSMVILIIPGFLWARLGTGAPNSATRVLPASVLILAGVVVLVAGTAVTLKEMSQPKPEVTKSC